MPGRLDREAWRFATHSQYIFRNGSLAVLLATQACEATNWQNPKFLDTLAAAYAETKCFERAAETAGRALELLDTRLFSQREAVQSRFHLYQDGQPFRETEFGANDRLWRKIDPAKY
jgi:serine/threonine-protein kinase